MESFPEETWNDILRSIPFEVTQVNGQRRYGPSSCSVQPPKGSEVFVGKLPRDLFEDELIPIFNKVGTIFEIRLMMDFSSSNRGFGFVMFTQPQSADLAILHLNNFEIRQGKRIGVCRSVDNCRLFVGGLPKDKTKREIFEEFDRITDGVVDVILYNNVADKSKSRGFAFIEYDSHRSAAMARRKLIPGRIPLWGHELAVDWAEPEPQVQAEVMARVTVLFVRNLSMSTSESELYEIFSIFRSLRIERVKKLRDYAFIHYYSREEAEVALTTFNGKLIDGCTVEVAWSKPPECALRHQSNSAVEGYRSYPRHCLISNEGTLAAARTERIHQNLISNGSQGMRATDAGNNVASVLNGSFGAVGDHRHARLIRPGLQFRPQNFTPRAPSAAALSARESLMHKQTNYIYPEILTQLCRDKGLGEPKFNVVDISDDTDGGAAFYACTVTLCDLDNEENHFIPSKFANSGELAKNNAALYAINYLGLDEACKSYFENVQRAAARPIAPPRPANFPFVDVGQGDGIGRPLLKSSRNNPAGSLPEVDENNNYLQPLNGACNTNNPILRPPPGFGNDRSQKSKLFTEFMAEQKVRKEELDYLEYLSRKVVNITVSEQDENNNRKEEDENEN